jgi:hypothetical protein
MCYVEHIFKKAHWALLKINQLENGLCSIVGQLFHLPRFCSPDDDYPVPHSSGAGSF